MRSLYLGVSLAISSVNVVLAATCDEYAKKSATSAAAMSTEVAAPNRSDRKNAYADYIGLFDRKARVHGLVPNKTAGIADVKEHYRAVFFELGGGVLIEDSRIVAGEMTAHRYHSMTTLNGVFDSFEAKDKPVVLRGQSFFRFNDKGRIVERWSNHDHAYRMGQLLGEDGRAEGEKLAAVLNGPGLTEQEGYDFVDRFVSAFSMAEAPQERAEAMSDRLDDALVLRGIGCASAGKDALMAHLQELWSSAPDLFMTLSDRPMSGWSMVAFKWRSKGSLRAPYEGVEAEHGASVS